MGKETTLNVAMIGAGRVCSIKKVAHSVDTSSNGTVRLFWSSGAFSTWHREDIALTRPPCPRA